MGNRLCCNHRAMEVYILAIKEIDGASKDLAFLFGESTTNTTLIQDKSILTI